MFCVCVLHGPFPANTCSLDLRLDIHRHRTSRSHNQLLLAHNWTATLCFPTSRSSGGEKMWRTNENWNEKREFQAGAMWTQSRFGICVPAVRSSQSLAAVWWCRVMTWLKEADCNLCIFTRLNWQLDAVRGREEPVWSYIYMWLA